MAIQTTHVIVQRLTSWASRPPTVVMKHLSSFCELHRVEHFGLEQSYPNRINRLNIGASFIVTIPLQSRFLSAMKPSLPALFLFSPCPWLCAQQKNQKHLRIRLLSRNSLNSPILRPRGIGWRKEGTFSTLSLAREKRAGSVTMPTFGFRNSIKILSAALTSNWMRAEIRDFRISDQSDATLHGFEIQLKDDYGKEEMGPHDVGGVIKTSGPKINAVKPAGEWNEMTVRLKELGAHG